MYKSDIPTIREMKQLFAITVICMMMIQPFVGCQPYKSFDYTRTHMKYDSHSCDEGDVGDVGEDDSKLKPIKILHMGQFKIRHI